MPSPRALIQVPNQTDANFVLNVISPDRRFCTTRAREEIKDRMHTKLADVDDTRPPERFTLQSTARAAAHRAARRRSARGNGHAGMERTPSSTTGTSAVRTRHWLSQEDDALVYAREVHMDCSRPAATMPVLTSTMVSESTRCWTDDAPRCINRAAG